MDVFHFRHFLITRADGTFVTQRQVPKLAGVKTSIVGQELQLDYEGKEYIRTPLYPKFSKDFIVPVR